MVIGVCAKEIAPAPILFLPESTSHAAAYNGIGNPSSAKDDTVLDVGFCEKAFPDVCMKAGRMGNTF